MFQFVEAPAFSRYRDDYLDDEGFRNLQEGLVRNPEAGDLRPSFTIPTMGMNCNANISNDCLRLGSEC